MVFSSFPEEIDESAILSLASKAGHYHVNGQGSYHAHVEDNETVSIVTNDLVSLEPRSHMNGHNSSKHSHALYNNNHSTLMHSVGGRSVTSEGKRSKR